MVDAYASGDHVGEIAERFGVDRNTVHNVLKLADVARRPRGLDEDQALQAVRMYADGLSVARIARYFGFAPSGIDRLLKKHGVVLRDRRWRQPRA